MSERDHTWTSDDQTAEKVEKIEEFLARLTRQLQDEVKSSNAKRTEPDGRRVMMADPHAEEARADRRPEQ